VLALVAILPWWAPIGLVSCSAISGASDPAMMDTKPGGRSFSTLNHNDVVPPG
jgi:hypothetical protein